jgi:predicted nucleic acid-binding protein
LPVLDASVVSEWVVPNAPPDSPAKRLLVRLSGGDAPLVGPGLLLQEVANRLLTGVRTGRWDGVGADDAFRRLRALPLQLVNDPRDLVRAWELSRRHENHPVYDMVYVAVAERLNVEFITDDRRLLRRATALPWVRALDE